MPCQPFSFVHLPHWSIPVRAALPLAVMLLVALQLSCNTRTTPVTDTTQSGQPLDTRSLPTNASRQETISSQQRMIADLLFAGLQALDDDRLLTPADDNALSRFRRVLAFDPDNEIALQGVQDIVARYLELAAEASRQGLWEEAGVMLDRARVVDDGHPGIAAAARELEAEKESGDLFFRFDGGDLARRTEGVRNQLAEVAQQARQYNAFFLITAPSDELARWMFSVMREAVAGYRLRGNIELAGRSSIRLLLPQQDR